MTFQGFSADTLAFLADLAVHNDRSWFSANRERYERVLLEPQRAFVDAVGEAFSVIDPRVRCEPSVDRSIYRINRDTRFTRDKSPYKTYADLWFWIGADRKHSPGYFVRIVPEAVWVGGGAHYLSPEQLVAYRAAVVSERAGSELATIVRAAEADGFEVDERTLARVPRGFSAEHPRADLLRFTRLHAIEQVSPPPGELFSEAFVGWCLERFSRTQPLVDWLADNLS